MIPGIDISHHQGTPDLTAAAASGIKFCIHKATQGTRYVDPMLYVNRTKALAAGLLFGMYHFGTGDDVVRQVDHFLMAAEDTPLLALDFEQNTQGPSMNILEAESFAERVQASTGRWPVLYTGNWLKDMHVQSDILCQCPLWIAQYAPAPVLPMGFADWSLWQFSQSHEVEGIGKCDADWFNGDQLALEAFWRGDKPVVISNVQGETNGP